MIFSVTSNKGGSSGAIISSYLLCSASSRTTVKPVTNLTTKPTLGEPTSIPFWSKSSKLPPSPTTYSLSSIARPHRERVFQYPAPLPTPNRRPFPPGPIGQHSDTVSSRHSLTRQHLLLMTLFGGGGRSGTPIGGDA